MLIGVWGFGFLRFGPETGIRLFHHLLAEIDADQVVLKNIVVEHVLRGLTEIDDPLSEVRRLDAESHVLGVAGAGGMVIAANAASDEMGVAGVLALHENAVATED